MGSPLHCTYRSHRTSSNTAQRKGSIPNTFWFPKRMGTEADFRSQIVKHLCQSTKFRMITRAAIIASLDWGDWFLALDLQAIYFHIAIHLSDKRFLCFMISQDHFQYRVFPLGLLSAPVVFLEVLTVAALLCWWRIIVFPYLEDWILKRQLCNKVLSAVRTAMTLSDRLGLYLNIEKVSG